MTTMSAAGLSRPSHRVDLGEVGRWVRAIPLKHNMLALAVVGALIPALFAFGGAAFTALGPGALTPGADGTPDPQYLHFIVLGYLVLGQVLLIVATAWLHLTDVRTGGIAQSYLAQPSRWGVLIGTAMFAAAVGFLSAALATAVAFTTYILAAGVGPGALLTMPGAVLLMVGIPVSAAMLCALGCAVAVLVRRPVLTVLLLVGWVTFVEDTLGGLPIIGWVIRTFGPMANAYALSGVASDGGVGAPALCALWLLALTIGGVALAGVVERRRCGWVAA